MIPPQDDTLAIRLQADRTAYREHAVPIFMTSSFVYDSAEHAQAMFAGEIEGNIYSRFTNPNTTELVNKLAALEGTETGVVTASGMAAVFATLAAHLKQGDHVVACSALFGNSLYILQHILPSWGIDVTLVDTQDISEWPSAFRPATRLLLVETPTNPGLDILDLQGLSDLCKAHDAMLAVDNCFATPILQKPAQLGAGPDHP